MFEEIEHVVYINLDEREDRKIQVQQELLRVFPASKIQRFSAIKNTTHGGYGCSMSHIAVLELAKQNGWSNVLVVEDDFMWTGLTNGATVLAKLLRNPFDVIVVSGAFVNYIPETFRLQSCQTTTAYIVHQSYYETLLNNFKEGVSKLQETGKYGTYALDQFWKLLQKKDNWYIVVPNIAVQRPGFSDIEKQHVDYVYAFNYYNRK